MTFENLDHQPVSQNHPMGCAVACVASVTQTNYDQALLNFQIIENAWTRGFYCSEVVSALARMGMDYQYAEFESQKHSSFLEKPGTIAFVAPNQKYPSGHYLLRTRKGWMNPWSNFPAMNPVQSAIEKNLPGEISHLIFR